MAANQIGGEEITLQEAQEMTRAFQSRYVESPRAFYSDKAPVMRLLEQNECTGIRIYNAFDEANGSVNIVMVGVNEDGKDITDGILIDRMRPCPDYCDTGSALMTP